MMKPETPSSSHRMGQPSSTLYVHHHPDPTVWSITIHVAMYVIIAVSITDAFFSGVVPLNAPGGTNCVYERSGGTSQRRGGGTDGCVSETQLIGWSRTFVAFFLFQRHISDYIKRVRIGRLDVFVCVNPRSSRRALGTYEGLNGQEHDETAPRCTQMHGTYHLFIPVELGSGRRRGGAARTAAAAEAETTALSTAARSATKDSGTDASRK